mgnify:CR=1 FL=1
MKDEDAMLCNTLWSDRRRLVTKKHFLPFRVPLNVGIDPNFPLKKFFGFIQRKISLSGKNIFSLAMLSAIFYMKSINHDIHTKQHGKGENLRKVFLSNATCSFNNTDSVDKFQIATLPEMNQERKPIN